MVYLSLRTGQPVPLVSIYLSPVSTHTHTPRHTQTCTHNTYTHIHTISTGTKYDLRNGDVLEWAPGGGNPVRSFLNNVKKAQDARPLAVYPTQVKGGVGFFMPAWSRLATGLHTTTPPRGR